MCRSEKIVSVDGSVSEEEDMGFDHDIVQGWINAEAIDRARSSLHRFLAQLQRASSEQQHASIPSTIHAPSLKRRIQQDLTRDLSNNFPLEFKSPRGK